MMEIKYPNTRIEEVMETRAGVSFPDPYRWLEAETEEVRTWQQDQAQLAADYVRQWPYFDTLRQSVARFSMDSDFFQSPPLPRFAGDNWFRVEIPEGSSQAQVIASDDPFGDGKVLFDPRNENPDTPPFVSWISPSPDGKILAVGVCSDGSEKNTIRLVDVYTGEFLSNPPPQILMDYWTGGAAWLPDSSGFYFTGLVGDPRNVEQKVLFHSLADGSQKTAEIPFPDPESRDYTLITVSADGRYLVANHGFMTPIPVAVKNLSATEPLWRPFITDISRTVAGHAVGDRFVAVTDVDAPRGRVVAIALDNPTPNDPSTWIELVPESDAVIRSLQPVGDRLYLTEFVDTYARVRMVDIHGNEIGIVPLPGKGAISELGFPLTNMVPRGQSGQAGGFYFTFSSLTQSWGVYCHRAGAEDRIDVIKTPEVVIENAVVEDLWATSADGTMIPYHTVRLKGVDASIPQPTMIWAYGGFNVPWVPVFPGAMAAFVAAGGVFVHGHLRGGAEFGLEWWEGGRMQNKQNCYADLYAIAQQLIDAGKTSSDLLAVTGGSNGGLMSGVAVTQRPDLWKAVVLRAPILDLVGSLRDPYALMVSSQEFCDPDDPEELRRMAGFSPYHLVKDGTQYPAVFINAGDTDPRVPPWHSRKFGARLQAANAADTPILIRVWGNVGHGFATDKQIQITENTEWLAFVMRHLGMTVS